MEGSVHEAIAAIMAEVGGVAKTRKNPQQGYTYRGIADVTLACQLVMAKHQVHVTPHMVLQETSDYVDTKSGGKMLHMRQTIEYRFYHADGSWFPCVVTGEAMDSGDKTSNKVMSAALKYALVQTFCIPEEDPTVDTETDSPEIKAEVKKVVTPEPAKVQDNLTPATEPQLRAIQAILSKLGITDDLARHEKVSKLLNIPGTIASFKGLTREQASKVITALGGQS